MTVTAFDGAIARLATDQDLPAGYAEKVLSQDLKGHLKEPAVLAALKAKGVTVDPKGNLKQGKPPEATLGQTIEQGFNAIGDGAQTTHKKTVEGVEATAGFVGETAVKGFNAAVGGVKNALHAIENGAQAVQGVKSGFYGIGNEAQHLQRKTAAMLKSENSAASLPPPATTHSLTPQTPLPMALAMNKEQSPSHHKGHLAHTRHKGHQASGGVTRIRSVIPPPSHTPNMA